MIITCPNCQTRYQVAERAIGNAGRKVSCAQCQQSWLAKPEAEPERPRPELVKSDPAAEKNYEAPLSASEETALDDRLSSGDTGPQFAETASEGEAGTASALDPALKGKRRRAMLKRQADLRKKLPIGRIRSNLRFAAVVLFAWLIGGGLYFRTDIVRVIPDFAGVYAVIGLPVNVVGLEFEDVETLRTLRNGTDVMEVTGQIRNVTGRQISVPAIVVSILDSRGQSLYSWSVTPITRSIGPFETLDFATEVNSAPAAADRIKLTFADNRGT